MTQPVTFGDIGDTTKPLAVLVHGFPDTPFTWRHLGPALADRGYRVVAPWLPGYDAPVGRPIGVGTYARHVLDVAARHDADGQAVLIGHDWGAQAGYGAVAVQPNAFRRFVALAVPPVGALAAGLFTYQQLRRSFYIWFIQQIGLAESAMLAPGFWEALWSDWSPGYNPADDIAELRRRVDSNNIADVIAPYRASFNPDFADPDTVAEAEATMQPPPVPTLYLHGRADGAIGADILPDLGPHLPTPGSAAEIIDNVGHFLHLEMPDLIAAKIVAWLDTS
ncbi:alpha/beta hydrolase [Mycobacterium sp. 852002-51961_SCH5331710]|uniref:alpha/beta fold hydrolase n=1 Tax=Mycobacterium sp. 852002-51961_SCH5331710 TaxID=1834105 RepID=UPI0007FCA30D|nr:alpha/beta hydrolase [Mycobacterium sp. 852002-51961_SCH5331710]OBB37374.1 alpha/beta hydrolase [Mycobacterium sp. 852002-51961_SCH5331710]